MNWYVFLIVGLAVITLSLVITIVKMEKTIRKLNVIYGLSLQIIGVYNVLYGNLSNDDISKAKLILSSEQRKQKS